jgi:hypothetical protein
MSGDCAAAGWSTVNTLSAVGYLVSAGFLVRGVAIGRLPGASLVLAAAVAAQGAGSMLVHGGVAGGAIVLHDLALLAMVGYLAGWHVGRLRGTAQAGAVTGSMLAVVVLVIPLPWFRGPTGVVAALALAAIAVSEVVARRRGALAVWTRELLAVAGVAALAWFAGRSGSPLCDPGSPLQPHAVWHLLTAYLVVAWAYRAAAADGA